MIDSLVLARRWRRLAAVFGLGCALGGGVAVARIGDTPEQMSARLLQPNLGRVFSWPKDMKPKERERQQKESPVANLAVLFPPAGDEWREQIFWKSALARQINDENGWRVHVYYLKGRSVLELYRRVGAPLNDSEIAAILGRMRGNQTWRKIPKKEKVDGAEKKDTQPDSIIGYDFELGEEGSEVLRARKQGDWLVVYHKRFDDYLAARKIRADEVDAQRKSEQDAANEKTTPASVEGF